MKKTILFGLFGLFLGAATSCVDLDDKKDNNDYLIVEPDQRVFVFDENGVPSHISAPTLSAAGQQTLYDEVVGYGWRRTFTCEINDDGTIKSEDYFYLLDGAGPITYYIKTAEELHRYFYVDAVPMNAYNIQPITIDAKTGTLYDANSTHFSLRIFAIGQHNDKWHIYAIEPLGLRSNGNSYKTVWGCTDLVRMTDEELKRKQDESQLLETYN